MQPTKKKRRAPDTLQAVCPYYDRVLQLKIFCEGILPGSNTIAHNFKSMEERKNHMEYCCKSFHYGSRCPIAKLLDEIDEESET